MRKRIRSVIVLAAALAVLAVLGAALAFAENIDPGGDDSQYAWGENVGWLNAEPSGEGGSGVHVTDAWVVGFIWGENIGWISLCCYNTDSCDTVAYCVANDNGGNLSGYAWGENVGWISFSCTNTNSCDKVQYRVRIDPQTGVFSGYAWGENIGWISFSDDAPVAYGVKTSWSSPGTPGSDSDGDGFKDEVEWYLPSDCLDNCTNNPGVHDAWPLDIDMSKDVSVTGDVFKYRGRIGARPGDANWRQRLDLDQSSDISVTGDVFKYRGKIGQTCT